MVCHSSRNRSRLRMVGSILTLAQTRQSGMTTLHQRRLKRGETERTAVANGDVRYLIIAKRFLKIRRTCDNKKSGKNERWKEVRRKKKLPNMSRQKGPPALSLKNNAVRRAALQWYCGTYPILPIPITRQQSVLQRLSQNLEALLTRTK